MDSQPRGVLWEMEAEERGFGRQREGGTGGGEGVRTAFLEHSTGHQRSGVWLEPCFVYVKIIF